MKNRNDAFTLVELLAVIVILAIILVIAVPKVMSVIEDSRKATLESTAKMIASSAEKAKVQNSVLGNKEEITCESVAKLNDVDYEKCVISFEGDTAKVTIKGSGKFDGLNVCNGTKTISTSIDEICPIEYGKGTTYISKLLEEESTLKNGLFVDDTADKNIRYRGATPNNKVYFNCKDKDSNNIEYGNEGYVYEDNCEVWRIIGVFDTKSSESDEEGVPRIKIVRDSLPVKMSWDSSSNNGGTDNNSGYGINQWGEVKDSNGNIIYEGSDLMRMLNGYYVGKEDTCTYCNGVNQGECTSDCTSKINPVSKISLSMIDDVLWNLGASGWASKLLLSSMYLRERSTQNGKNCSLSDLCNDTIIRTTIWKGKIGLIYPSDYGYASYSENCANDIYGSDSTCNENNWLHLNNDNYWVITPYAVSGTSAVVYSINSYHHVNDTYTRSSLSVRPTVYLKSDIQIIGGNGNNEPYILQ